MTRFVEVTLLKRQVTARARLLDEEAPRTCQAIWDALPLQGPAFHAKWANNEVYGIYPAFEPLDVGREHATIFPIPGDLLYWYFPAGTTVNPELRQLWGEKGAVDLAIFYGRNNYLVGAEGPLPGNLWAVVVEGLGEIAAACTDVWRSGSLGEELLVRRHGES